MLREDRGKFVCNINLPPEVPKAETLEAIAESDEFFEAENKPRFNDIDAMFKSLKI